MFEVILHQYDLSQGMAKNISVSLTGKYFEGIWHTGICVYNKEYYYGGGVSYDRMGQTPFGTPTKVISLGFSEIPEELFMEFLREARDEWSMEKYHVFEHNCNHFTNAAADFLLGEGIPSEIINQPAEFLQTPLGNMIKPMMQGMQDNLKVQSNPIFDGAGGTNEVRQQAPQGIYGQGGAGAGGVPSMPGMPGMGGAGAGGMPAMPGMGAGAGAGAGAGGAGAGGLPAGMMDQLPPQMRQMAEGMDPAMLQNLMQRFGGMGGGQASAPIQIEAKVGEVCQIASLSHIQKLIKESPGLIVDFWSPTCPPCMRIKPTFENAAKSNDNPNLVFAACNTAEVRDAPGAFQVNAIPNFIAFHNGSQIKNFKGANEAQLFQTVAELSEKVPKGKVVGAHTHDRLAFTQFKPNHLAPQSFLAQTNLDKMKQFIQKFADSETVKKEVGAVDNFQEWIKTFALDNIPQKAIDELVQMTEVAEERSKIALIDLVRLLMQYEPSAAHILYKHWETFDISIFQYLLCMDIKDASNKVIHNYHLVSLKMLGNLYQTQTGLEFVSEPDPSSQIIQFCEYSLGSSNPKTVFTAAVVLFNHVLTYKRDLKPINQYLENALMTALEHLNNINDADSLNAILLCEIRIIYKNADILTKVLSIKDKFVKVHEDLRNRTTENTVKLAITDLFLMIGHD